MLYVEELGGVHIHRQRYWPFAELLLTRISCLYVVIMHQVTVNDSEHNLGKRARIWLLFLVL